MSTSTETAPHQAVTVPDNAAGLVQLATLERREFQARVLLKRAQRDVGAIPEDEATDADLDYVTDTYMAWAAAWETLSDARRALGMEKV